MFVVFIAKHGPNLTRNPPAGFERSAGLQPGILATVSDLPPLTPLSRSPRNAVITRAEARGICFCMGIPPSPFLCKCTFQRASIFEDASADSARLAGAHGAGRA